MPKYFQAPATQDSTSPLTSTSGSATDMISIQPQNNTFLFKKKKKKKGSSRPEWTQDKSYSFSSQLQKPDYLRLSCGYFQIVSCGWLLGASAQTKRPAGEDLRLSFSFVGMQQINVGIKIPQLLLFITMTSARLILILTVSTKT